MYRKLYIPLIFLMSVLFACQELEIPPKNIMTDEDIYNEGGIKAYMTGLYSRLPMEDFNTTSDRSRGGYFSWNCISWPQLSTGETVNRNNPGLYYHVTQYWSEGYQIIRRANSLIENLPEYIGELYGAEEWIAEARFLRAYTYFALVKRYGGVPIIDKVQEIQEDESELWVARNSHEECYDFMLEDLDYAIANLPKTSEKGRANKYVAAAFKSRVALFAGSIAKYGGNFTHYSSDDVMLCGIPSERANDYFKQVLDASAVVEDGGYSLYQGNSDLDENFASIFTKADNSSESIFIRQYDFNNYVHSFDAVYSPPRMSSTYGDRYNVTLDWVELFDGLPVDPSTGRLKTTDDAGNYIVYNSPTDLFENAEPRLKGSILLPNHTYKTVELDIRKGVIDESIDPSTPIEKFIEDDGSTTTSYNNVAWFKQNVHTTSENLYTQTPYVTSEGVKLNKNGLDGPTNGGSWPTLTGFHGRKWLNTSLTPATTTLHTSYQTWIDIRYAEVLLNRAEAALELGQDGEESYNGVDLMNDAFECINKIRSRAGAELLTSKFDLYAFPAYERGEGPGGFVYAPNRGLQILRVERYKELAFEHKLYWDLKRWFSFDKQIYNYRRRMLNPFLFAKGASIDGGGNPVGKCIYDTRVCEYANNNLTFQTRYYYDAIPGGQLSVNPLLEQNDQY